ncbi:Fic family protein [Furfurilactobacillus rossiae]
MNQIYELRGQMANLRLKNPAVLTRMTKVAKIESTDASNRIEGIYTSQTRLKKIVSQTTTPQNRSEAEISGYRDVLNLIHTNFREINLTTSNILTLHKHLFRFTEDSWSGHFKDINNQVLETTENGETTVRFNPPAAHLTPNLVDELCQQFSEAVDRSKLPVLLLCAAFTFDFVTIHPFRDGNGRMSRLLMLLTLSRAGFTVGQFISLEKLIEEQKDACYAILQERDRWLVGE